MIPFTLDVQLIDYSQPDYFESKGIRCKGGGDSVDTAYNARMATIYENQNQWADQFNDFWAEFEKPYEQAKIEANQRMLEGDTSLAMETTAAERELLPLQTEQAAAEAQSGTAAAESAMESLPYQTEQATAEAQYGTANAKSAMELLPMATDYEKERLATATDREQRMQPVQEKYFSGVLNGVDAESWAANAQADAAGAFMSSTSGMEMAMARRGATPGSGAYSGKTNESAMGRAMTLGKAASGGRESGERESFSRLSGAMNYGG